MCYKERDVHRIQKKDKAREAVSRLKRTNRLRESERTERKKELEAQKQGKTYSSGVLLRKESMKKEALNAWKKERQEMRNKKKCKRCCIYYPFFCKSVGHDTAAEKACDMYNKSSTEKEVASKRVMELVVEQYEKKSKGTFVLLYFFYRS